MKIDSSQCCIGTRIRYHDDGEVERIRGLAGTIIALDNEGCVIKIDGGRRGTLWVDWTHAGFHFSLTGDWVEVEG